MLRHDLAIHLVLAAAVAWGGCDCGETDLYGDRPLTVIEPTAIDFGAVADGDGEARAFRVENAGGGTLQLTVRLASGSDAAFHLEQAILDLGPQEGVTLEVSYLPRAPGLHVGRIELIGDDPGAPEGRIELQGGPIAPALRIEPDPVSFVPATAAIEERTVTLHNDGLARLRVTAAAIDPAGSQGFTLDPVTLPQTVLPGESLALTAVYARSYGETLGALTVTSDDPVAERRVELVPDPYPPCDETDPAGCPCVGSEERGCYAGPPGTTQVGRCQDGVQTCVDGAWGSCEGQVLPGTEDCTGLDDDCDGLTDEDDVCGPCNPDGVYQLTSSGRIQYACCLGLVSIDVTQLVVSSGGTVVRGAPDGPGPDMVGAAATCPQGTFDHVGVDAGGCTESYAFEGSFTGADTLEGTLQLTFTGNDCGCILGTACTSQSYPVTASR